MTIRIAGVLLILSVSFYIGMTLAANEQKRVAELRAFCRLIEAIQDGIASLKLPLPDICMQFSDPYLESSGFLPYLRATIKDGNDDVLTDAYRHFCDGGHCAVNAEERVLLESFFSAIGHWDSDGEVRRCTYYLTLLQKRLAVAEETAAANTKISRILPLSLGGLVVILVL